MSFDLAEHGAPIVGTMVAGIRAPPTALLVGGFCFPFVPQEQVDSRKVVERFLLERLKSRSHVRR